MDYAKLIKETVEELLAVEQRQKQGLLRDRVRFVRLLKAEVVKTQRQAGEQIGLKERQSRDSGTPIKIRAWRGCYLTPIEVRLVNFPPLR